MTNKEISKLPVKALKIFEDRLKLLRADKDVRDEINNFIIINPMVDGRILNIREPLKHHD